MSKPLLFNTPPPQESSKINHRGYLFRKGQKVCYEGEQAEIIRVKPLLVIKSGKRIVCGNLYNYLGIAGEDKSN